MARKHPHLFANEIKGISPRTFGVELTGSGYGIAAAITGISNDFPHTNPRNGYLYDRLLREYFRNCNNTVTDGLIHNDAADLFPNSMDAGFTPNDYSNSPPFRDFFDPDPSSNLMLTTGTPLTTYSGHCVFFNNGKPMFHGAEDIAPPPGVDFNSISPCIQRLIGSKANNSVGPTGFYRTLQLTGVKFNTAADKARTNSNGGRIKKVILDNKGNGKFHDIFFRDPFTGSFASNSPGGVGPTLNFGCRFGSAGDLNHSSGFIGSPPHKVFSRLNLHNNFLDLGKNGTFGPFATGTMYSRTLTNGTSLKNGKKYRLLFTRVQNNKIIEHLQHSDFPISGITYLDLFEQNFDIPKKDGVHVHVFNFGKVRLQTNPGISGGQEGPSGPNPLKFFYKSFQQSGNPNAPGTGGTIDFSAFNLYTALLD